VGPTGVDRAKDRARGLFITFEGPEGGGKTSQIGILEKRLAEAGISVTTTREPGGTSAGERIRDVLLDPGSGDLRVETEAFLVLAARSELVSEVIRPALEAGHVVICDRYADATRAYQGYGGGLPIDVLNGMIELATGGLEPDLTVLLDLPVEVGLARRRTDRLEWTRLDAAATDYHQKVRNGYLEMAADGSQRWAVIDADRDPASVADSVWQSVAKLLADPAPQAPAVEDRR
jgi:dTMP kinase